MGVLLKQPGPTGVLPEGGQLFAKLLHQLLSVAELGSGPLTRVGPLEQVRGLLPGKGQQGHHDRRALGHDLAQSWASLRLPGSKVGRQEGMGTRNRRRVRMTKLPVKLSQLSQACRITKPSPHTP
ncbi:hypothetical protein AALO_G00259900, partial [Alosa alosa]